MYDGGTSLRDLGVLLAFVLQVRESLFFWQAFGDQREANQ
jgi:hypothetical protein